MYMDEMKKKDQCLEKMEADYEKIKEQGLEMARQLHKLNTERLGLMKDNQYLKFHLSQQNQRASLSGGELARRQSQLASLGNLNPRIFGTEDEEGEMFTDTCLADLKSGRMQSDNFGRKTLPLEEIMKRNSMLPPALRSTYPQDTMDLNLKFTEDEIRVIFSNFKLKAKFDFF